MATEQAAAASDAAPAGAVRAEGPAARPLLVDTALEAALVRDGFVLVPFLDDDEVSALRAEHERLHPPGAGFEPDYFRDDPAFKRQVDAVVRPAVAPRLDRWFDRCAPFMTSFLMKWPDEHSALGLHRDWSYVDERRFRTVVVWVALDDTSDALGNGPLRVVRGSHTVVPRFRGTFTEDPFGEHRDLILRHCLSEVPVRAGEAVIMDNRLVHASFPNRSGRPRLAVATAVRPEEARLLHPFQHGDRIDLHEVDEDFFIEHSPPTLKEAGPPPYPVVERVAAPTDRLAEDELLAAAGVVRPAPAEVPPTVASSVPRPARASLRARVVGRALAADRQAIERVVGEGTPFVSTRGLGWARRLEAAHEGIRAEVDRLLDADLRLPRMAEVLGVDQGDEGRWRTLVLLAQGHRIDANLDRLPCTAAAIGEVPGLQSALLSVFPAGMHLPPHRAGNKGVLRYHLGLRVPGPAGRCRLRVGEETVDYREGASILFDDTFEHEAWNDADGDRITLLLEVLRPLPAPLAVLNRAVQGLYGSAHPEAAGAARRVVELDEALNGRHDVPVPA